MDVSDIISNPHAMARNMVVEVTDDDGSTLSMEGVFPKMSRSPGKLHNAGREIGADNNNILKDNSCKKVLFAGKVSKPNFSKLKLDLKGIYYMPRIIKSSKIGDAAILKEIINILKEQSISLKQIKI